MKKSFKVAFAVAVVFFLTGIMAGGHEETVVAIGIALGLVNLLFDAFMLDNIGSGWVKKFKRWLGWFIWIESVIGAITYISALLLARPIRDPAAFTAILTFLMKPAVVIGFVISLMCLNERNTDTTTVQKPR